MIVIDQLKHNDPPLRAIAITLLGGVALLLAGLWYVQIVSAKKYAQNLTNQSFRSVRIPAIRGKILDRNGAILAENRARYGVNLYLEELPAQFTFAYTNIVKPAYLARNPGAKIKGAVRAELEKQARYWVVSNLTVRVLDTLRLPPRFDPPSFQRHYERRLYVPFPLARGLTAQQMALFVERLPDTPGVELEIQPARSYPWGSLAAHVLGYVQPQDRPPSDDEPTYTYYLPDYAGVSGIEAAFEEELRGQAGAKSLLVNNLGYRQREELRSESEPGRNVWLTIDQEIQVAVEKALASANANPRGAAVVVDVHTGDILALASVPAYDPNAFVSGLNQEEVAQLLDPKMKPLFNRATFGARPPGSIFKILTGLACLEAGELDPDELFPSPGHFRDPKLLGRRKIDDTAPPGDYNFKRAFKLSSNTYFIHHGLKAGMKRVLEMGQRFGLGAKTGLPVRQEVAGFFPTYEEVANRWSLGNLANVCIGQEIDVTPLQMAMVTAAIANGGKLLWPRLVMQIGPMDSPTETKGVFFPGPEVRRDLHLNPKHLEIIHQAMVADVEDPDGTGKAARVSGFALAAKTGTAEIKGNGMRDKCTWFVSFGPAERPRYAVVVMVESGASGGLSCAPVAGKIYQAIQRVEAARSNSSANVASSG